MKAPSPKAADVSVAAPPSRDLVLPWRKSGRADEHITDDIDFSPVGSCTYRHILDRNDELVAIVCVESVDDDAAAELKARTALFLAAPDLLEALKGYRDALLMGPLDIAAKYGPDFNPDDVVIEADKVACAAIAKATDQGATRTSSEASTSISNPSNTGVKDE